MWDRAEAHTQSRLAGGKTTEDVDLFATRGLQTLRLLLATSVLPALCRSQEANDVIKETKSLTLTILGDQMPRCSEILLLVNANT